MKKLSQPEVAKMIGEGKTIFGIGINGVFNEDTFLENIDYECSFSFKELEECLSEGNVFIAEDVDEVVSQLEYPEFRDYCANNTNLCEYVEGEEVTLLVGDPFSLKATPLSVFNYYDDYSGNLNLALLFKLHGGCYFISTLNEAEETCQTELIE
ncbi:hypothetical protein HOD29_02695 [archaeon]|jgi:hypothetical protein|nr:hypothetical protein [archaeon]